MPKNKIYKGLFCLLAVLALGLISAAPSNADSHWSVPATPAISEISARISED